MNSLLVLFQCVLSDGLSLNGFEFNLRVNLSIPNLDVDVCCEEYASLVVKASR